MTKPSWLEGGVYLDREFLREEQLKDPACVDALCWIKNSQKPERKEILSTGINQKVLWASFDCLVIQDGLLYKQVGPLTDGSGLMTVYCPASLRKEMIRQCHDTRTAGHC